MTDAVKKTVDVDSFDDLLQAEDILPTVRVTVRQAWADPKTGLPRQFSFRLGVLTRAEVMDSDMQIEAPTAPSAGVYASFLEKQRWEKDQLRYNDQVRGARLVKALQKVGFEGLPSGTTVQQYEALKAKMPSAMVTQLLTANEELIKGKQSLISEALFPVQRVLEAIGAGDAALGTNPEPVEVALANG